MVDKSVTEEVVDESTAEEPATEAPTTGMSEVDPEEIETGQKMWLSEKGTSLENENTELKKAIQTMETRLITQEDVVKQVDERFARFETAITQIAELIQQQNAAIESSRALMNSIVEEVNTPRDNFQKVGIVM